MGDNEFSLEKHFDSKGNPKDPDEVKVSTEQNLQPDLKFSDQEKIRADVAFEKTVGLPEDFDLGKIRDIDFLLDIFAEPYDKYKSLPYLLKMRDKLLKRGYPETPILNEYLFWTTISRRLQIEYQIIHVRNVKSNRPEAEPLGTLKVMKGIAEQITFLQKALNDTLEKFEKISGVVDLHQETLDEIEKFVEENIGEHSLKCFKCGEIINTQGLPHWAISKQDEPTGEKIYFVFSPEMWYLYQRKILPLHLMAFILRTSVEGILITAKKRKEKMLSLSPEDISKEEEKSKVLLSDFEKRLK